MNFFFIFTLILLSLNSFAASENSNAVDKFTSYLPLGLYLGQTVNGFDCSVSVKKIDPTKKDIEIKVNSGDLHLDKIIQEDSEFMSRDHKREFIQTERIYLTKEDDYNYLEKIIRTVNALDNKLYLVLSSSHIVDGDLGSLLVLECLL